MTSSIEHSVPFSHFVRKYGSGYWSELILSVLQARNELTKGQRQSLNSAIQAAVRIKGFKNASRADPSVLEPQIRLKFLEGNDKIIGAFLKVWVAVRADVRDAVTAHLARLDIPAHGPNLRKRCFDHLWPEDEWMSMADEILESNTEFDNTDVEVMLCYVSGRAPDDRTVEQVVKSPLLRRLLEELDELEPGAPDWVDMDGFLEEASRIAKHKAYRHNVELTADFRESVDAMERGYKDELEYLEVGLARWWLDALAMHEYLPRARELSGALEAKLAEYRSVWPRGSSRKEEAERAPIRAELENAIVDIDAKWDQLVEEFRDQLDAEAAAEPADDVASASGSGTGSAEEKMGRGDDGKLVAEPPGKWDTEGAAGEERQQLTSEVERLEGEVKTLMTAKEGLERVEKDLTADRDSLKEENARLEDELDSRRWLDKVRRDGYVQSQVSRVGGDAEEKSPQPTNMAEAIRLAQDAFPDHLLFALNSKSDKSSQFLRPGEVFGALSWLATDYHQLRKDPPGKPPPFDSLLKAACPGWSYKPQQAALTKGMYNDWYTTEVNGRSYDLGAHLGKGTDHDPQTTIRIAFAWDDDERKVVIGYIGMHQRGRLT